MGKGYYGREPFDLRLTVLRMIDKLPVIAAVTLAGCLLFGGCYFVKNILLQGEAQYSVTSRYRVEYAVAEEKDVSTVHINQTSWNTYLQTELFLDAALRHMTELSGEEKGVFPDHSKLAEMLEAVLASDLRVLATVVTTNSPEESILIAQAVERAMTEEFAEEIREIVGIEVIDHGDTAVRVVPDVRPARAFALSAVLSCFFAVTVLLLKELGDDSIWLPSSLWKRYGLKAAGTLDSRELAENLNYFFREAAGHVVLCAAEEGIDSEEVLDALKEKCPDTVKGWQTLAGSVFSPEACGTLRHGRGILLAVPSGSHSGRKLEHVLEYLEQQDCQVTAALLWGADERLIRRYYGLLWGRRLERNEFPGT